MALDFIATTNEKEINWSEPIYSLSEDVHKYILTLARPLSNFPMVRKIADYYVDATILFGEIKNFIMELEKLIQVSKTKSSDLLELIRFLETAWIKEQNVYVFCD